MPCRALFTTSRKVTCQGWTEGAPVSGDGSAAAPRSRRPVLPLPLLRLLVRLLLKPSTILLSRSAPLLPPPPPLPPPPLVLPLLLLAHRSKAVQQGRRPHAAVHQHDKQEAQHVEAHAEEVKEEVLQNKQGKGRRTPMEWQLCMHYVRGQGQPNVLAG